LPLFWGFQNGGYKMKRMVDKAWTFPKQMNSFLSQERIIHD
jgi:hypothetical protein